MKLATCCLTSTLGLLATHRIDTRTADTCVRHRVWQHDATIDAAKLSSLNQIIILCRFYDRFLGPFGPVIIFIAAESQTDIC